LSATAAAAHEFLLRRSDSASSVHTGPDDNPARRLQFYLSHLLFLLKKIVSYDYAGAAWTVWQWLHGYIRRRRIAQTKSTSDDSSAAPAAGGGKAGGRPPPAAPVSNSLQSPFSLQRSLVMQGNSRPVSIPESPGVSSDMDPDESDYDDDYDRPVGRPIPSSRVLPLHALLEEEKKGDDDTASRSSARAAAADRGKATVPPQLRAAPPPAALVSTHRRQSSDSTAYHDLDRDSVSMTSASPRPHHKLGNKNLLKRISISLRKREDSDSSLQELGREISFVRQERAPPPYGEPPALGGQSLRVAGAAQPVTPPSTAEAVAVAAAPTPPRLVTLADSAYFFETAASRESLKKMSIDVPVPDRNGYVLGDDFLPDSRYTPLLVFVNSRAGPQQGHLLITQLRRLLNPIQVWDLADGGPDDVLESFLVFTRLRILVCGGDGTVSWIVSVLEGMKKKIRPKKWPPIAILPLGTGNDLARIHGWGGGYNNESLITILEQIAESYISLLDIWEVTVDPKNSKKKEVKSFFNYLGVGADAQAALQVHYLRESRPDWFFSRVVNKLWYGVFGAEDLLLSSSVNVRKEIKLLADGVEVSIPPDSQGIIILNIDSYAGGVPLWSHGTKGRSVTVRTLKSPRRSQSMNTLSRQANPMDRVDSMDDMQMLCSEEERIERVMACDMESSCQDGILEIVSIRGAFHLGQIKVGLSNAQRLCQCREAVITIKNNVPVQVDGEPWRQRPCTLTVRRKQAQAVMLHRSSDDGGVETEMSKLLDWAEERQLIDGEVHSILMKEYSRRIESKNRRRRVREQDNIMHTLKKAISQSAIGSNLQTSHNWQGGISF
jgi:diacylglycerol kinase (ATP)